MKSYVLAISGGVDSVVLLDMISKIPGIKLVIAHFDHGIRDDSKNDAVFVEKLAQKYNLTFETKREELGVNASEEMARDRRYAFLNDIAKRYDAKLVTAQHADDAIETIAINLYRGTGWRGLSAMDSDVLRPLIHMTKQEILNYAQKYNLSWREDSTNKSDNYLRNRLRRKLSNLDEDIKLQLLGLWAEQKFIKKQIDQEVEKIVASKNAYRRYFYINIDEASAIECLRQITWSRLTRPQLRKLLHQIKTAKPHKDFLAGSGIKVHFASRNFTVELIE